SGNRAPVSGLAGAHRLAGCARARDLTRDLRPGPGRSDTRLEAPGPSAAGSGRSSGEPAGGVPEPWALLCRKSTGLPGQDRQRPSEAVGQGTGSLGATLWRAPGDRRRDLGPGVSFRPRLAPARGGASPCDAGLYGTPPRPLLSRTPGRLGHPGTGSSAGRDPALLLGRGDGTAAAPALEVSALRRRRGRGWTTRHLALGAGQPGLHRKLSARAWLE